MEDKTLELVKKLQEVSNQNVTVQNSVTITENTSYKTFKLIFWDKNKDFIENLKQRRIYNTEKELQAELNSLIFTLS